MWHRALSRLASCQYILGECHHIDSRQHGKRSVWLWQTDGRTGRLTEMPHSVVCTSVAWYDSHSTPLSFRIAPITAVQRHTTERPHCSLLDFVNRMRYVTSRVIRRDSDRCVLSHDKLQRRPLLWIASCVWVFWNCQFTWPGWSMV